VSFSAAGVEKDKGLVLDANILVRAVLGKRVGDILERHHHHAKFFSPEICFEEAREHLPAILKKRGIDPSHALETLDHLRAIVQPVKATFYRRLERTARSRIRSRDDDDWPALALALSLNLPIWTEGQDLFGVGIATWTTDRIELYFEDV
jgi:predicted nucleic acid-binding protein